MITLVPCKDCDGHGHPYPSNTKKGGYEVICGTEGCSKKGKRGDTLQESADNWNKVNRKNGRKRTRKNADESTGGEG